MSLKEIKSFGDFSKGLNEANTKKVNEANEIDLFSEMFSAVASWTEENGFKIESVPELDKLVPKESPSTSKDVYKRENIEALVATVGQHFADAPWLDAFMAAAEAVLQMKLSGRSGEYRYAFGGGARAGGYKVSAASSFVDLFRQGITYGQH